MLDWTGVAVASGRDGPCSRRFRELLPVSVTTQPRIAKQPYLRAFYMGYDILINSHPSNHKTKFHSVTMEATQKFQSALFQVYLRLRPPPTQNALYPTLPTAAGERFLTVEEAQGDGDVYPTHITLNPPNDNRRRAVEKFAFTKVFEEDASQLDVFQGTGVLPLVEGVLGPSGGEGRDGLLATLGVTGSGKVCFVVCLLNTCTTSWNRLLTMIVDTEPHNPRFSKPTRSNTTCPRRALPLH
jgi:hypothetical protein